MSAPGAGAADIDPRHPLVPERIELRVRDRRLCLCWPDGLEAALSATTLRSACRCAACAHLRRTDVPVPIDPDIGLESVAEFGVAGLQIVFSDGHRRGIFPWEYLRQLATRAG